MEKKSLFQHILLIFQISGDLSLRSLKLVSVLEQVGDSFSGSEYRLVLAHVDRVVLKSWIVRTLGIISITQTAFHQRL